MARGQNAQVTITAVPTVIALVAYGFDTARTVYPSPGTDQVTSRTRVTAYGAESLESFASRAG